MIKGIDLVLSNGNFIIEKGDSFTATDSTMPFLCYEENGVCHAECTPDGGGLYDARIVIPHTCRPEWISIKLKCASVTSCGVTCGSFKGDIKESSVILHEIQARRINMSLGCCNAVIYAKPLVAADFLCGHGKTQIFFSNMTRGYKYNTFCGAGELTLNSKKLGRECSCGNPVGVPVNISCGMGRVSISDMCSM